MANNHPEMDNNSATSSEYVDPDGLPWKDYSGIRRQQRTDNSVVSRQQRTYDNTPATSDYDEPDRETVVDHTGVSRQQRTDNSVVSRQQRTNRSRRHLPSTRYDNTSARSDCDEPDRETVVLKKILVSILVATLCVGLVVGGILLIPGLLSTPDAEQPLQPLVHKGRLEQNIFFNLSVTNSVIEEYEVINITLPDGGFNLIDKKEQLKRSTSEWSVFFHTSQEDNTIIYLQGPKIDCEAEGQYSLHFFKGLGVLYTSLFEVRVEVGFELSGNIQRSTQNDKEFFCFGKTGCATSNFVVYETDNELKTPLKDMEAEYKRFYDKQKGFRHEIKGKTQRSDLVCRFDVAKSTDKEDQLILSECNSSPCSNGGTCSVPKGGTDYLCLCPLGFTGRTCQTDIDECLSSPCRNNGTCRDGINGYKCQCAPGFTHTNCLIDTNECHQGSCLHGGTCFDGVNSYQCSCVDGFSGTRCEDEIDECLSNPCMNRASCQDYINYFMCLCPAGFDGKHCDRDINECATTPCVHGNCSDEIGGYRCTCDVGYIGSTCHIDINECESTPCVHGNCLDEIGGYRCTCDAGYIGSTCNIDIDYCADSPCLNGGDCLDGALGYTCSCAAGYEGSTCSVGQLGHQCTETTSCMENAACEDGKCVCPGPNVITSDGVYCRYGCNTTCNGTENDLYSVAGDVCGFTFKRCVNGQIYSTNCNSADVFNPFECVCVPRTDVSWCASNAPVSSSAEICKTSCTNYINP